MAHDADRCGSRRLSHAERHRSIAQAPVFSGLSATDVDRLAHGTQLVLARQGDTLFSAGSSVSLLHLVVDGAVQIVLGNHAAGEDDICLRAEAATLLLETLVAGDLVGDIELLPLLAEQPIPIVRQSSGRVLTKTARLIAIRPYVLAQVLQDYAWLRARFAERVIQRLQRTQALLADFALLRTPGRVRLARLLLDFFDRLGRPGRRGIELRATFSHAALARALGLARRSVFADMKALKELGAIAYDRSGRLTLLDAMRLRDIACGEPARDRAQRRGMEPSMNGHRLGLNGNSPAKP
jgi:CRP-like cAMP-binding protein